MWQRIDPCVMPSESLSNVWISVIFPPHVETRVDGRLWQKWFDGDNTRYAAGFGSLDPNPRDCAVRGFADGSGPTPMEFRPTREGPFDLSYYVTGRVAKSGIGLSGEVRRVAINAIKP